MSTEHRTRLGLAVLVAFATWCFAATFGAAQGIENGKKEFANSIVPLPPSTGPTPAVTELKADAVKQTLPLNFEFGIPNESELRARVEKHEIISPAEMAEKYSGNVESIRKLEVWLKQQGFKSVEANSDNTAVYATATPEQIERSLGAKMVAVTINGETVPSASSPPSLPREIGNAVVSIDGLQPWVKARKRIVPRDKTSPGGLVPRPQAVTVPTYKVADILKAYNANGLNVPGKGAVTGAGQVIAILIDTLPSIVDVMSFWQRNNLQIDTKQLQLIKVHGSNLPDTEGEETLDTEWASGVAPGATVRVYASGSLSYADLDRAIDKIYADATQSNGLRHVSISLGLREDKVGAGELKAESLAFLKLAAIGVTTFVSSGDAGSNPDNTGHQRAKDVIVEYEASDPSVIGVGGTTLQLDRASGTVVKEVAWGDSGGGVSGVTSRPGWQNAYPSIPSSHRLVPDVSAVADPQPGAFVIFHGQEYPVGGTSWSTPIWAGFSALIADARQKQGKPPLGFLAPALYKLHGSGFRDILAGTNGAYQAGPGWDPVTGIGVPNIKALIGALP
jgi:kumamolisin